MQNIATLFFIVFIEGALSLDNALVLALMVRCLPDTKRRQALTYGMAGAFGFRLLALCFVSYIMAYAWIKILGGAYLIYLALKYFMSPPENEETKKELTFSSFWRVVLAVELMDIAFSVDNILAAVALSNNIVIIFVGGVLGIALMRMAASAFIKLLDRWPGLESTAFMLIFVVGAKLFLQGVSVQLPEYVYWGCMLGAMAYGFLPKGECDAHDNCG